LAISISRRAERTARSVDVRVILLVTVAAVALGAGAFFLSRSSVFHARGVEVTGTGHLTRADVVATAGVSTATNVVWLDEGMAERRLEAEPWIADADVWVSFPWTIRIAVRERVPVAVASDGISETLVAEDGTALGPADRTRGLPRIELLAAAALEGAPASPRGAAMAVGALPVDLRADLASVTVLVDGSIEIRMRGGPLVRYGSATEPRRKAAMLGRILAWAQAEREEIALVNLVTPDRPSVRLAS
jgi:cell division protein FtsQ